MHYYVFVPIFIVLLFPILPCQEYKVTDQVFFDIAIDNEHVGRIVIGLFGEIVPKTVENFKVLSSHGIDNQNYTGSIFHRVIQRFMIQGGDVVYNNGSGSVSIYGDHFIDENFVVKHTGPGYISMANYGLDTNGCQFFITTIATPWLDDNHVAFGKVVEGQAIVHKIEHLKTDVNDKPLKMVKIIKSGILPLSNFYFVSDFQYSLWSWIKGGVIPLSFSFIIMGFFHWVIKRLDSFQLPEKLD